MTVIVEGHGSRLDDQKTFVPVGTKLRFYLGFDVDISQNVELVAIADGAKATAQETIDGTGKKDDVSNYELGTVDDEFVARWTALGGESGIRIYFVGASEIKDGARLCDLPDRCDGTHGCRPSPTSTMPTSRASPTVAPPMSWPAGSSSFSGTGTMATPPPMFAARQTSRRAPSPSPRGEPSTRGRWTWPASPPSGQLSSKR
jgi:hypothetical protein